MSDLPIEAQSEKSSPSPATPEDNAFAEFRRKIRGSEALSAAMLRLLLRLRFTGRISVVLQNGRVLKCGYEEGYFRAREGRLLP
jgi:hypothetical protein